MSAEFDQYADSYRDVINKYAAASGESLEFYIELRIQLLRARLASVGAPPPARILDFGCGIGITEVHLRRHFPDAAIVGVDESAESIGVAERLGLPNARFVATRDEVLPIDAGSFDLVYSNGTFHHIDRARHAATVRQLYRAVRPGGHAFVFENNPYNPVMLYAMHRSPIDRDAHTLRPGYLAKVMRAAGFDARSPEFYAFFPAALARLRPAEPWLRRVPVGAQYFVWGTAARG
jgi:SAM-dependent methyltransferase